MNPLFLLPCALLAVSVQAGVYKWVDQDGNVHYSDRPVQDSEQVRLRGVGAGTPPAAAPGPQDSQPVLTGPYTRLEILDPQAGTSLHPEKGEVRVSLLLEPALQQGHRIGLTMNGQPVLGDFSSTQLMLQNVSLGSHTLRALILDAEGATLASSAEIQFHVRRPAAPEGAK